MNKKQGMIVAGILVCATFIAFINPPADSYTYELKAFSSYEELASFLKNNYKHINNVYMLEDAYQKSAGIAEGASPDFSKTNIQVEGVDEPDIIKTDGLYIYLLANGKIFIIKAYPPENASISSEISIEESCYPVNIFINENFLIVFCSSFRYSMEKSSYWSTSTTTIKIYNITNKTNPKIIRNIEVDGNYFDSRMLDRYIYVITNKYDLYYILENNETIDVLEIRINNETKKVPASSIYYVDMPDAINTITNVVAIDLKSGEVNQKSFLIGGTQSIYVSKNNIFLTSPYFSIERYTIGTVIHRISISEGNISYEAKGEVPGYILNQFSMDEFNDFLRIATTTGNIWDGTSSNNIYILDGNLTIVGKIENIAVGEKIYSARFIGDKAYLVTFKKVDPFFTIDLSEPYNPKVLGKLKIPGYSDYLHPYDENHIIGIGKETIEALEIEKDERDLDFAWYEGLKIALFDVSDFKNPKEVAKVVIGDRGTDSPVLYDHKALLFDKEKELFVIPVSLYEISDEIKEKYNYTGSVYGEFTFQGVYVYNLDLEKGFVFVGRITHMVNVSERWQYDAFITRALYIDDVLYTISDKMIKMNDLKTLEEINSIELKM